MKGLVWISIAVMIQGATTPVTNSPATGAAIKELQFWALSSERPGPEQQVTSRGWSIYDFRDSIVVRAVVEASEPSPKVLMLASAQIQAGRIVWTDKTHETVDVDRVQQQAVWLPASTAVEIPLSQARRTVDGSFIVELGVVRPERFLIKLREYDPQMVTVGLRVTARLIGARVSPKGAVASRQIGLSMGD
jgi:hypothetical protein